MEESSLSEFLSLSQPTQHFHLTQPLPVSPRELKSRSVQRCPRPRPVLDSAAVPEPFYLYQNHPRRIVFPISLSQTATKRRSMTHKTIRKACAVEDQKQTIESHSTRKRPFIDLVETERYRLSLM